MKRLKKIFKTEINRWIKLAVFVLLWLTLSFFTLTFIMGMDVEAVPLVYAAIISFIWISLLFGLALKTLIEKVTNI